MGKWDAKYFERKRGNGIVLTARDGEAGVEKVARKGRIYFIVESCCVLEAGGHCCG